MAKAKQTEMDKIKDAAENQEPATNEPARAVDATKLSDDWNFENFQRVTSEIIRLKEGEAIMGFYDGSKVLPEDQSDFDEDVLIHYVIDHETNARLSFVGGMMADRAFQEADIQPGEPVFIRYMGKGSTRKGNAVNNWDIRVKR